jgi:hypothetical protein
VRFRKSTRANAAYVMLAMTPGLGFYFHYRTDTDAEAAGGGEIALPVPLEQQPVWLKLVKSGPAVKAYYALGRDEPTEWKRAASPQAIALGDSYMAGMAVCSNNEEAQCTASFGNVAVEFLGSSSVAESSDPIPAPANIAAPNGAVTATPVAPGSDGQVILEDRFDDLKKLPSGNGWSYGTRGGSVVVADAVGLGGKSLRFFDEARNADVWAKHVFPEQSGAFVIELKVRFSQVTDGFGFDLMKGETLAARLETYRGQLAVQKGNNDWKTLQPYKQGGWYLVRFNIDCKKATMDVDVDGEQKAAGIPLMNKAGSIDAWCAGSSVPATGAMFLSTVKVSAVQ